MLYKLQTNKKIEKFLIKHPEFQNKFFEKFENIAENPFKNNSDIKKLKGFKNHYRLRIGKYRFLYEIIDKKIIIYIYDADSRGDIYK